MKKWMTICAAVLVAVSSFAQEERTKELERVDNAAKVLNEIMAAPDKGIPEEILAAAECVSIVPSMIKAGFVVGGRYGKGVATCRNGPKWSAPAPIRIEGGSWGLQIGGEAVDLVMLVMNERGMQHLLSSKFQIGGDASAAAGPVGRHAEAATNWKMQSEILTYSRAKGVFAGLTLNGAVVRQDEDDTKALYGRMISFQNILKGQAPPPAGTEKFVATVAKYFRSARAEKKSAQNTNSAAPAASAAAGQSSPMTSSMVASQPPSVTTGTQSMFASGSQTGTAPTGTATTTQGQTSTGVGSTTTTTTGGAATAQQPTTGQPAAPTGTAPTATRGTGATAPQAPTGASQGSAPAASTPAPTSGATTGSESATSAPGASPGGVQYGTAAGGVTPSQPAVTNNDVRSAILTAMNEDRKLAHTNVSVTVTEEMVELYGKVNSQEDRKKLIGIATQNAAGRRVVDKELTLK